MKKGWTKHMTRDKVLNAVEIFKSTDQLFDLTFPNEQFMYSIFYFWSQMCADTRTFIDI